MKSLTRTVFRYLAVVGLIAAPQLNVASLSAAEMEQWDGPIPKRILDPKFKIGPLVIKFAKGEIISEFELNQIKSAKAGSVLYREQARPLVEYLVLDQPLSPSGSTDLVFESGSLFQAQGTPHTFLYCYSIAASPAPQQLATGTHCLVFNAMSSQIVSYKKYADNPAGESELSINIAPIPGRIIYEPLEIVFSNEDGESRYNLKRELGSGSITIVFSEKAGTPPYIPEKEIVLKQIKGNIIEVGIADAMNSASWFSNGKNKAKFVKNTKQKITLDALPARLQIGGAEILVHSIGNDSISYEVRSGFSPWAYLSRENEILLIRGAEMNQYIPSSN